MQDVHVSRGKKTCGPSYPPRVLRPCMHAQFLFLLPSKQPYASTLIFNLHSHRHMPKKLHPVRPTTHLVEHDDAHDPFEHTIFIQHTESTMGFATIVVAPLGVYNDHPDHNRLHVNLIASRTRRLHPRRLSAAPSNLVVV